MRREIVTKFLLDTCQPPHRIDEKALLAWLNYSALATQQMSFMGVEFELVPLVTGSSAEFYVQPPFSCVGDVDIMSHSIGMLAIPAGSSPPTELPAEFDSRVEVYEIIESEYPGYVYLETSYVLKECIHEGKYRAVQCERIYVPHLAATDGVVSIHGPAVLVDWYKKQPKPRDDDIILSTIFTADQVNCVRCLSWPPQSADWPTRHRNYDWQDSATVDRVVSNGCDVVPIANHLCRQDELWSHMQWRLSFSRAEIVLLNSWMPVQQIVYHVLRVFLKDVEITGSADNSGANTLSNYHIKTLMLWACELKPVSWWTDDLNIVRICVELLQDLAVWLIDARSCQHYFIKNCDLFFHLDNSCCEITARRLILVDGEGFTDWFINVYMIKCAQRFPSEVTRLLEDVSTNTRLQKALSTISDFRLRLSLTVAANFFLAVQFTLMQFVSCKCLKMRSFLWLKTHLEKMHHALSINFTAVIFLHVAHKAVKHSLKDKMLNILLTTLLNKQFSDVRRCLNARHSSVLSLSIATMLMKVVANNSRSTVQLIEIELSKAYLYRALRLSDYDSDSIYCLANVYLAVMYYTTGLYQKAIDHCTVVTRSHDHSQCSSHVVQGELLPQINDDVDSTLGLVEFYDYIRTAMFGQEQQTRHVSVVTTELFAHYLHIKCLSATESHHATEMSLTDEIRKYGNCMSTMPQMFTADFLLFNSVNRTNYPPSDQQMMPCKSQSKPLLSRELETSVLVELLQKSAVEHLTTFRQLEAQEFGSLYPIVTTDFEALYAYKCCAYERCLRLSAENVSMLIGGGCMSSAVFAFPEIIRLIDDDFASLTGLTALINPSYREDLRLVQLSQLTLSLYLMTQCQIKLHHPVKSLTLTLAHVKVALRNRGSHLFTLDERALEFTECKILRYVSAQQ